MEQPQFYTTPQGILSDEDAHEIESNFDTAPEEGKPYLAAKLNEYQVFRAHFPKPLSEYEQELRATDFRTLHGLATDWDGTVTKLPEERRAALDFSAETDPEPYKRQAWNQAYIDHVTREQSQSPEDYASRRAAFARAHFNGVGADDDATFHVAAKNQIIDQVNENNLISELGTNAVKAAMAGKPYRPVAASWESQARAKPGFKADRLDYYNQAGLDAYEEAIKRQAAYNDTVQEVLGVLRRRTGLEEGGDGALQMREVEALADKFVSAGYSREQRDWILQSVAVQAEEMGIDAKGFFKQFGESMVRGAEGVVIGGAYGLGRAAMQGLEGMMRDQASRSFEAADRAPEFLRPTIEGVGNTAQGIADTMHRQAARVDMAEALRRFGDEEIDAIKPILKGWMGRVESGAYGIGSTLPSLLSASGPGLMMQAGSMANDTYMELREKYPTMTAGQAQQIAIPAGVIMGALDRVEAMVGLGGINKGVMGKAFREWVEHKYIRSMGVAAGVEFATETAQNFVPVAMQELQAKLFEDIPDPEFWAEAEALLAQSPETFIAVLPLAALAGGTGVYANRKAARALLTSPDGMRLAGIAPEKIDLISAMAKDGQVDQAIDALREAWTNRDKSVSMAENVVAVAAEYKAEAEQRVKAAAESGITIKRVADGWEVRDAEGNATTHAQFENAEAELYRAAGEAAAQIDETVLAGMASYAQSAPVGESFTFTDKTKSAAEDYLKAKAVGDDDLAQNILNRIEIERQRTGGGPDADYYIFGQNETLTDVKGQIVEMANRLFRGANVETLIEEKSEGVAKRWIAGGKSSIDKIAQALRAVSAATGGEYLHGYVEGGDAQANAQAVIEGYSKLAQEYAIGRSAQGEASAQSGVTRALGTQLGTQQRRTMARLREAEKMNVGGKILKAARDTWDVFRASVNAAMKTAAAIDTDASLDEIRAMLEESVGLSPEAKVVRDVERAVVEEAKAEAPADPGPLPTVVTAPPADAPKDLPSLTNVTMLPDGTWIAGPTTHSIKPGAGDATVDAFDDYAQRENIPEGKAKVGKRALKAAVDKAREAALPAWQELVMTAKYAGSFRVLAQEDQVQNLRKALKTGKSVSSIMLKFLKGGIPAWDPVGAVIETPADIHQLMLAIRSPHFESLKILLIDENMTVVGGEIASVGGLQEATADPRVMGQVLQRLARQSTGARVAGFIISHNHPSGQPEPSPEDRNMTTKWANAGLSLGFPMLDHVVTNGERYFSFKEAGIMPTTTTTPGPAPKPGTGTYKGGRFRPREDALADWELVPRSEKPGSLSALEASAPIVQTLRTADPDHAHIIVVDTKLHVTAVARVPMDLGEMTQVIAHHMTNEGGSSYFLSVPQKYKGSWDVVYNTLAEYGRQAGHRILDMFVQAPDGTTKSARQGWTTTFSMRAAPPAAARDSWAMPDQAHLVGPATFAIRAFHGTPHKVDRFSLSKVGTGEWVQAYGWGLYFAQEAQVATKYIPQDIVQDEKMLAAYQRAEAVEDYEAMTFWEDAMLHKTRDQLAEIHAELMEPKDLERHLKAWDKIQAASGGNLYTVELLPDEEDFLDWDKRLSEQSPKVRAALNALGVYVPDPDKAPKNDDRWTWLKNEGDMDASRMHSSLDDILGVEVPIEDYPKWASLTLAKAGIPGIRYLDQNSRSDGQGTRNFVLFDESLVKIIAENGRPVDTSYSIRVRHGAGVKFDRFSTDFIGEGAGAQVYGWGIYFTDTPEVARDYQRMAAATAGLMEVNGETMTALEALELFPVQRERMRGWWNDWVRDALATHSYLPPDARAYRAKKAANQRLAFELEELARTMRLTGWRQAQGFAYEAEIAAELEELLDFNRPAKGQGSIITDALHRLAMQEDLAPIDLNRTGEEIYRDLSTILGGDRQASEAMARAGIKGSYHEATYHGIRGIEGPGGGLPRNFVVFDDNLITITRSQHGPVTWSLRQVDQEITDVLWQKQTADIHAGNFEGGKVRQLAHKFRRMLEGAKWRPVDLAKKNADTERRVEEASERLVYVLERAREAFPEFVSWYDKRLRQAIGIMQELDPGLNDPDHLFIFKAALAIASNGNAVGPQTEFAYEVYKHWKAGNTLESYKGPMGERSKDIRKTLGLVDHLIATQGIKGAKAWLDNSGAKSTVKKAIIDALGVTPKKAEDLTKGELIDEVLPFSVIFGSKLGSFYNNLNGRFDTITMDRWFMRTIGRTMGTQLTKVSGARLAAAKSRLVGALTIAREKHKNHPYISQFRGMNRDYDRIAKASHRWTSKEVNRDTITDIPELNELRLAANAWHKVGDGYELNDSPGSGLERRRIRLASLRALEKFKKKTGVTFSPAEFQAVLWYYEKAVHESHGSRQKEDSPDYASGANTLFTKIKGKGSKKFKPSEAMTPPYSRSDWDPDKADPAPSRLSDLPTYSMAPVRMKGVQRAYLSPDSDEIGPVAEWWQIDLPDTYWHGSDILMPLGSTQVDAMKATLAKYEALPEAKATLTPEAIDRLTTFALSSADYIDRLADRFANPQGAPETRVRMYMDARERLQGLARSIRLNESLDVAVTMDGLRRQASARRRAELAQWRTTGMTYRQAQRQAKANADEWLAAQVATLPARAKDQEATAVYRAMLALEQMLAAFPPDVRRQVGGFIGIAREKTQKGREKFLAERAERAQAAVEEFLRRELRQEIANLFERATPTGGAGDRRQGKLGAWRHRWFARAEEYALTGPAEIAAAVARWQQIITDAQAGNVPDDVMDELRLRWGVEVVVDQASALDMVNEELALAETVGASLWGPPYPGENATEAEWAAYRAAQRNTMNAADLDGAFSTLQDAYDTSRLDWLAELARRREEAKDFRDTTLLPALGYDANNLPDPGSILEGGAPTPANRAAAAAREQFSFEQTVGDIFGDSEPIRDWADNWERAAAVQEKLALDGRTYDLRTALHQILATESITELHRRLAALAIPEDLGLPKLPRASQLELASLIMRYNEEGSQEWMEENGYGAAWQAQAVTKLRAETRAIMAWISRQYDADYNRINQVYSQEKGVDLPRVAGYAGMRLSERGSELQQMAVDGNVMEGGLSSGFTKTRVQKPAGPPRVENILAQYLRHAHQVEHYRAWARPMREMRQRLGHRETMMAIEARRGRRARGQVNDWLNIFDQGGVRQAGAQSAVGAWLRRMLSTQSEAALAFNLGTRLKQMPAAVQALADIRFGQFLRSAARIATGTGATTPMRMLQSPAMATRRDDWRSNATALQVQLQREGRRRSAANLIRQSFFWAFDNLAAIDAAFTSFGAAVSYDAAYREASALPEAERRRFAERRAGQAVSRTAQPNRAGTKSLWENQANVYARLLFRFQSANRQVLANEVYALKHWRKDPERAIRIFILAHFIIPAMVQSLANVLKHAFTDKEAEEIWEIEDYLLAFAMGPISGLILIGPIIEGVMARFKGFAPRMATVPLADLLERAMREWANGKTEVDDFKAAILLAAMTFGGDASAANAADQIWRQALGAKKSFDEFLAD